MQIVKSPALVLLLAGTLAGGCASVTNPPPVLPPAQPAPAPAQTIPVPATPEPVPAVSAPEPAPAVSSPEPPAPAEPAPASGDWARLPGWGADNLSDALPAFLVSCESLRNQPDWKAVCAAAAQVPARDPSAARRFFETRFVPYRLNNNGAGTEGLVTGYYEPLLRGSRSPTRTFRYPLYMPPDDLLVVDLVEANPDLKGMRLRGRLQGKKIVPYYTRAEIERGEAPVRGKELLWVDDAVELFFLQVQGSGRVRLPGGETVRVGFAEHNGHPYKSVGRVLVERGQLPADKASMQGIKQWARENPDLLPMLLHQNPAYVFFRELPESPLGPIGSLGVALTPGRSIAVDASQVPLGAPVFLATTWPMSTRPLNRLVLAQDTGSAIKGRVRADFFWGFGEEAGQNAGRMKQSGSMWLLYPLGFKPPLP